MVELNERIKELKRDKERQEELLQLRDKDITDLKAKIERFENEIGKMEREAKDKIEKMEKVKDILRRL